MDCRVALPAGLAPLYAIHGDGIAPSDHTGVVIELGTHAGHPPLTGQLMRDTARLAVNALVAGSPVVVRSAEEARVGFVVAAILALVSADHDPASERFRSYHGTVDGLTLRTAGLLCPAFRTNLGCPDAARRVGNVVAFYPGRFSNWFPAPFFAPRPLDPDGAPRLFSCLEQYLMLAKARLFGDEKAAGAIMRRDDPYDHKRLGRSVKGYDDARWCAARAELFYVGLRYRFGVGCDRHPGDHACGPVDPGRAARDRAALVATGDATIVEASPRDRIWGVGVGVDAALRGERAPGATNILGLALERLRAELAAPTEPAEPASPNP
jgi:predicted NAD-dependent protein-ADP-ribosyltransferase YbiA (DUF1768 family)